MAGQDSKKGIWNRAPKQVELLGDLESIAGENTKTMPLPIPGLTRLRNHSKLTYSASIAAKAINIMRDCTKQLCISEERLAAAEKRMDEIEKAIEEEEKIICPARNEERADCLTASERQTEKQPFVGKSMFPSRSKRLADPLWEEQLYPKRTSHDRSYAPKPKSLSPPKLHDPVHQYSKPKQTIKETQEEGVIFNASEDEIIYIEDSSPRLHIPNPFAFDFDEYSVPGPEEIGFQNLSQEQIKGLNLFKPSK